MSPRQREQQVHLEPGGASPPTSMSDDLIERIRKNDTTSLHFNAEVTALPGEQTLAAVTQRSADLESRIDAAGLFTRVGATPNTGWLAGLADLDSKGLVVTGDGNYTTWTSILAVGDVRAGSVRRVASAVGEGSVVISKVWAVVAGVGHWMKGPAQRFSIHAASWQVLRAASGGHWHAPSMSLNARLEPLAAQARVGVCPTGRRRWQVGRRIAVPLQAGQPVRSQRQELAGLDLPRSALGLTFIGEVGKAKVGCLVGL